MHYLICNITDYEIYVYIYADIYYIYTIFQKDFIERLLSTHLKTQPISLGIKLQACSSLQKTEVDNMFDSPLLRRALPFHNQTSTGYLKMLCFPVRTLILSKIH